MQSSVLKYLPLILAAVVLVSAIAFASQKLASKKKIDGIFTKLPEPTPFVPVKPFRADTGVAPTATLTPTPTATPIPTIGEKDTDKNITKGGQKTVSSTTITKTETVCTPVYGMANSCAEHTVVDTGLETSAFSTLAAISYFGGLAAFIKAKRKNAQ